MDAREGRLWVLNHDPAVYCGCKALNQIKIKRLYKCHEPYEPGKGTIFSIPR